MIKNYFVFKYIYWFFLTFFLACVGETPPLERIQTDAKNLSLQGSLSHSFMVINASYGKDYIQDHEIFTTNKINYTKKHQIPSEFIKIESPSQAQSWGLNLEERSPPWIKVYVMKHLLEKIQKQNDKLSPQFLGWFDTDTIFMYQPPKVFDNMLKKYFQDDKTLLVIAPDADPQHHLINTGVFFIRNHPESLIFLQKLIDDAPEKYKKGTTQDGVFWEQSTLQHLLKTNQYFQERTVITPYRSFNSIAFVEYPYFELDQKAFYQPGDPVIHFAGQTPQSFLSLFDGSYFHSFNGTSKELFAWRKDFFIFDIFDKTHFKKQLTF
jgi:hypothetical protein